MLRDDTSQHCWLLDFDRTLSSVDAIMKTVEHVCQQMGLDFTRILEQRQAREELGKIFSVPMVIESLWPESLQEFTRRFRVIVRVNCIYPDANRFIKNLEKTNQNYAIITYGDPEWQSAKMRHVGLIDVPHIICSVREKGVLLGQYKNDFAFELDTSNGLIRTNTITLVDDRPEAFKYMPSGVRGILINRQTVQDTYEDLPSNIMLIASFDELKIE